MPRVQINVGDYDKKEIKKAMDIVLFVYDYIIKDNQDKDDLRVILSKKNKLDKTLKLLSKYSKNIYTKNVKNILDEIGKTRNINFVNEFNKINRFVNGFAQAEIEPPRRRGSALKVAPPQFNVDNYVSNVIKKISRKHANKVVDIEEMLEKDKQIQKREKKQLKIVKKLTTTKPKPKRISPWIQHVKNYMNEHGVSYNRAIKESKATYKTTKETNRKRKLNKSESPWIQHVKKYMKDNNVSYKKAIKDSKASYVKPPPKPKVSVKIKKENKVEVYNLTDWKTHKKNVGKDTAHNTWFKPRDTQTMIRDKLRTTMARYKGFLHRARRMSLMVGETAQKESKELKDTYTPLLNRVVSWAKEGMEKYPNGRQRGWKVVNNPGEPKVPEVPEEKKEVKVVVKKEKPQEVKKKKKIKKEKLTRELLENMNKNYYGELNVQISDIEDIIYKNDMILIELKYKIDIKMYIDDEDDYTEDNIDSILLEKSDEGYNVELQQSYTNKNGETTKTAVDEFLIYT